MIINAFKDQGAIDIIGSDLGKQLSYMKERYNLGYYISWHILHISVLNMLSLFFLPPQKVSKTDANYVYSIRRINI